MAGTVPEVQWTRFNTELLLLFIIMCSNVCVFLIIRTGSPSVWDLLLPQQKTALSSFERIGVIQAFEKRNAFSRLFFFSPFLEEKNKKDENVQKVKPRCREFLRILLFYSQAVNI